MPKLTDHPSREELSAYSLGQLPEERAVAIDCHISECEPCCETIVELSSEDTFAGLLQEAGRLSTDQTADHDNATANSVSFDDIPQPLSEHPRYEVLGLIGKGGMGDVYKARHRKMERTVALKVINRGLVQKTEAIDRFHREVKAAAQLSHPNIVTAFDADQAGEFHFMVMEFVDGVDLSKTVKNKGALQVSDACDYIRQAALGLQHAHERGMVHRDIKPHNLMVTSDGTVKILDFGLASLAPEAIPASDAVAERSDLTAAGTIMGTPDFISPEQAEDARQVDIRSDIYSLGTTLYYLLSGRVPFDDGSVMHKLKSHAQVDPAPLSSVRDNLPQELVAIASKMMAKNPDERYLTPKEVAEALESFLRTWRPGDAISRPHDPASGGNMSGSNLIATDAGDMSRDWLRILTRWLFGLSLVPLALLLLDTFVLSEDPGEVVTNRFLYYLLASVTLSSVAGVLSGIHQIKNGNRDDQSTSKSTTGQTLLIAVILAGSVLSYFKADIVKFLSTQTSGESDAPSAFMAQFRAAEKITDQDRHDRAFAALAKNAANAGDVSMTKRALEHIRKRELESPTRRDCSIALFKTGKHDDAHGIAESIYYQHDRDAAFAAFAGTGDAKSADHEGKEVGENYEYQHWATKTQELPPGNVALPPSLSPEITSLVWVDPPKVTAEQIDQCLSRLLDAAPPEKKEWANELVDQWRSQAQPGLAALEKGIEAGIEAFVMGETTNPASAVAADVEEALEFVQSMSTAILYGTDVEDLDVEDFDADVTVSADSKPGQFYVRMRPDTHPEDAIAIMVASFVAEAGVIPGSEEAQALEEIKAMEFVEIGNRWFAVKGEEILQGQEQALDSSSFVRTLEKHKGAAIRFAWLMDDKTRVAFDQAQLEAGPLSFGSPLTSLQEMRSASCGIWLGEHPRIALDMEFANQEDAQLFKATFDKLVSSVVHITAFGTDDPVETLRGEQTGAGPSLLFLDRVEAGLSKTFDIALLQRLTVAGLPWTNLFESDPADESDKSNGVSETTARNFETPADEKHLQGVENGR